MIAFLSGEVLKVLEKSMILGVNGVGYEVMPSGLVLEKMKIGGDVDLFIHTHVREDQLTLYGFVSIEERQFFQQLISVSGIGPKTALEMLNQPVDKLKSAIAGEDVALLSRTPGIGKKTAERVILDLKGKIDAIEVISGDDGRVSVDVTVRDEVVTALEGLGYRRHQIVTHLKTVPEEIETAEEIVTYFLRNV